MFKISIGSPVSNPASCHPSLKKEDDSLRTPVLLKAGDREDNVEGYESFPLMQTL